MAKETKILGKTVHLYAGVDLMGSQTSVTSGRAEIEVLPYGVIVTSKKNKRKILIYQSNIKGVELLPEAKDGVM